MQDLFWLSSFFSCPPVTWWLWHLFPTLQQLCWVNSLGHDAGNEMTGRQNQTEKRKCARTESACVIPESRLWSVFVIIQRRKQCCWQKSPCIIGYFPILLSFLQTPSKLHWSCQSITAGHIWCSWQKRRRKRFCPRLTLLPASSLLMECDTTLEGVMSPEKIASMRKKNHGIISDQ